MSKQVLIVEDSHTQAAILRNYFEALGYEVNVAYSGAEALLVAGRLNPDIIVLDYQLPDMDGAEVCKKLKQELYLRIIPVIIYSAENKLRSMVNSYEVGANYYVVKDGESMQVLQILIETIFSRRVNRAPNFRLSAPPQPPNGFGTVSA